MNTEYYIEKDRKLLPSQDFQFLQKEGLKYIEQLGNKFWTDYNPHDPGVTILDVLCYAITELGYRSDFDIKDVITNKNGLIDNKTFFTAANIFTNAALTATDYRKLLIDIEGVANAWLLATQKSFDTDGYLQPNDAEAHIYLNKLEDKLSLKNTDKKNLLLPELKLRGLGKVKIELEEHPLLGDLNTLILEHAFWYQNHWVNLKIVPQFTNWNHPGTGLFTKMNKPGEITIESIKKTNGIVYLVVNRYSKPTDSLHFRIFVQDPAEMDVAENYFGKEKNVCEVISLFEQKKNKIEEIFATVTVTLQQNRNLGEDYLCTEIIEKVDIAICTDIEIEPGTDAIDVMSQAQIAIDSIISPKINFYTLAELVKEGYHSEDIFLGPRLSHGFLKDQEIEKAQLPTAIHASDIIAALMEVKGVKSVRNMLMTAYTPLGMPITGASNEKWVLNLPGDVKPVFTAERSKLLLFQKNIPFLLSETQQMLVEQKVDLYNTQFSQMKLKNSKDDFEIENGEYFELDTYYSIQDDFPANYGLGKNYISDKAPKLRKAQVKQLKGYLFFYEQLLADFFSQLYNAKDLLDTTPINRTYFPTYLEKDDTTGLDFYSKEIYSTDLQSRLLNGDTASDASLYETKTQYYERRNRALDHLLARFAESFNDYVFMMYRVSHDTSGMGEITFDYEDLITDKQNFLNAYPEISSNRGLGIDYLNATIQDNSLHFNPFWNTAHRGGYEKRTAKLLGINEIGLRNIVTEEAPQTQWTVETEPEQFVFKINNPAVGLTEKWNWAQLHFLDQNLYKIDDYAGNYYLYLVDGNVKIARLQKKFDNEQEAYVYLQKMIRAMNIYYENFFCLEHILLRPFNNKSFTDTDLLSVCLNDDCDDVANNDPYSFKATIVLPGYLSRFKSIIFREYAEKIFRQEAPAHVLLKICWVNIEDMLGFQQRYKSWLNAFRQYRLHFCANTLTTAQQNAYNKAHSELVAALKKLNTIYPEGNLYDCQLSESTNPIILGNTSLGTL
jgi:hypothetical protein